MSGWLGYERIHLADCDSTNDEAARLARAGAAHGTVVTADSQRAGRGRRGRRWHSPPGENLYLSCIVRPQLAPAEAVAITLAAGLGVSDAVRQVGVEATLKWPNDVLVNGRKLAGILTEMSTASAAVEHIIVGIGVNLGQQAFPPPLDQVATSLSEHGVSVERAAFLDMLLADLERRFESFFRDGVEALSDAWTARADRAPVQVTASGRTILGRVVGLASDGCLLVEDAAGVRHRVIAGDVVRAPAQ